MTHSSLSLARRLKLQQLAAFDTIVSAGSLLAASRQLHLTQPALSKLVQELESHFGQTLLLRSRRGVRPTEFGRLLHAHCRAMLNNLRLLADEINAWSGGASGQVVVGSLIVASAYLLPQALIRLRESSPQVGVEVRVGVNEAMFESLARGALDVVVGLLPAQEAESGLLHVSLFEEQLCVVVGRQHPWAGAAPPGLDALAAADWILPSSEAEATHAASQFFSALGLERPARAIESVSLLTNLGLLTQHDMVALMPASVARHFVRLGLLSVLPLASACPFGRIGYTLQRGRLLSPAAQRFIEALHHVASEEPLMYALGL